MNSAGEQTNLERSTVAVQQQQQPTMSSGQSLLPNRRGASDNVEAAAPRKRRRKRPSVAQPGPAILVQPGEGGPVEHPHANDVLFGRGGRVNGHAGNAAFRRCIHALCAEHVAAVRKKQKRHVWAKVVRTIRAEHQGRFLQQQGAEPAWVEVGDDKAITKVGQAFRDMLMTTTTTKPPPVDPVESATTVTTASPFVAASRLPTVEPGTAGQCIRPQGRNEHDVLCGLGGNIYRSPGNAAYLRIVAQYRTIYQDETKGKLERAGVPSQIIHDIRCKGGRFLEELDSGDWREIGDIKAIDKVRNALQYKKTKKEAETALGAIMDPPVQGDKTRAASAQVVEQGSPFVGIPVSERVPAPSTVGQKSAAVPGGDDNNNDTPEPTNVYAAAASVQGPKAAMPRTKISPLCSQKESNESPPMPNLKSPEPLPFEELKTEKAVFPDLSIFERKQPPSHDDTAATVDFCFQPPQPKPKAWVFGRTFVRPLRPSGNASDASSITSDGEFSVLSFSIGGLSTASSVVDLSEYGPTLHHHEEVLASAPGAPIASLSMDTSSSVLSPLLPDAGSLSSSSAPEEVRSTERQRPQPNEPDFASRRMERLGAGVMRDDTEDDISEMTGYMSGMSLMSRMDRCSLESLSIHTVSTPVPSMDGSF